MVQTYDNPDMTTEALGSTNLTTNGFQLDAPAARVPSGFWRRLVAAMVDSATYSVLSFPVTFLFGFAMGVSGVLSGTDPQHNTTMAALLTVGSYLISFAIAFLYYGWFYKNKGATPGKMLMRLRIARADTGTNLTYWRAFGRETLGKILSSMVLFIGFLLVVFRQDKRALHDLLFNTQVTYEPK
jgi:uncharacterized RDD family membrane protein YckC